MVDTNHWPRYAVSRMSVSLTAFRTPADLLAAGLQLPPLAIPPCPLPAPTYCAITGQPIQVGYPIAAMVSDATAEFLDCFRGGVDGYVSETAARCFKNADPKGGSPTAKPHFAFDDGTYWSPLVSRDGAARVKLEKGIDRPVWSDLVRQVWPGRRGQTCLIVLTTDTKKRLWIRARVGALGDATPILFVDGDANHFAVQLVAWPELLACLDVVEDVYGFGFPKTALATSLLTVTSMITLLGLASVRDLDRRLEPWRSHPVFPIALFIAQRSVAAVAALEARKSQKPERIVTHARNSTTVATRVVSEPDHPTQGSLF